MSGQGEFAGGEAEDVVRGGAFGLDGASADAGGGGAAVGRERADVPAPADEVMRMVDRYRTRHEGWNVRRFYSGYRRDGGTRSYGWVKDHLQKSGAVSKSKGRGKHRKRREPAPWPGMLLHQEGSDHAWVAGARWSMAGRGRYLDNIFIERLWRSLKCEAVYLHELTDGRDVERVIGSWFSGCCSSGACRRCPGAPWAEGCSGAGPRHRR